MTSHLPPEHRPPPPHKAAEVHPACAGNDICEHWQMAETLSALLGGVQATRVTHYKGEPQHRTFLSNEHPEGLCADGHDLVLERWVHEVMVAEGCVAHDAD